MSPNLFGNTFRFTLALLVSLTLLSVTVFFAQPWIQIIVLGLLVAGFVVFAWWRLDLAVLAALAELIVGSQGHLFFFDFQGMTVSVRLGIFLTLVLVWIVRRGWRWPILSKTVQGFWWIVGVFVILGIGVLNGYLRGNGLSNLFFDVNGYLYLGLLFLFLQTIPSRVSIGQLLEVFAAGIVFLALETFVLLAVFSHQYEVVSEVYRWARDTRLFEITAYAKNFYRIFSQSHLYSLLGFFLFGGILAFHTVEQRLRRRLVLLLVCASATLLVSFSRSFWLVFVIGIAFLLPTLLRRYGLWSWRSASRVVAASIGLLALELLLISFTANYPYVWNRPGGTAAFIVFQDRSTETDEAAISSRTQLLGPLLTAIGKQPVLGSGFGATVTYQTKDPRAAKEHGGFRTTYAFEWGYLDFAMKFGLIGLAVILGWLTALGRALYRKARTAEHGERAIFLGFFLAYAVLLLTHVTTPYLNHPLGLGFLMVVSALANEKL